MIIKKFLMYSILYDFTKEEEEIARKILIGFRIKTLAKKSGLSELKKQFKENDVHDPDLDRKIKHLEEDIKKVKYTATESAIEYILALRESKKSASAQYTKNSIPNEKQ